MREPYGTRTGPLSTAAGRFEVASPPENWTYDEAAQRFRPDHEHPPALCDHCKSRGYWIGGRYVHDFTGRAECGGTATFTRQRVTPINVFFPDEQGRMRFVPGNRSAQ